MSPQRVLDVLRALEGHGIRAWIDGGWGVDALIGRQTRSHDDLDLVVSLADVHELVRVLAGDGYAPAVEELPTRLVLLDGSGNRIDLHPVTFDALGGGTQQLQDGRAFRYHEDGFRARGLIHETPVSCLSPEVQAQCHYGYEPDDDDRHDMRLLRDTFGVLLREPYA